MLRVKRLRGLVAALLLTGCAGGPDALASFKTTAATPQPAAVAPATSSQPAAAVTHAPAQTSDTDTTREIPEQLLVSLAPGISKETFAARPEVAGLDIVYSFALGNHNVVKVHLPDVQAGPDIKARLAALSIVSGVYNDERLQAMGTITATAPNDPYYSRQWYHKKGFADTEEAWTVVAGLDQSQTILADVDSGLDMTHPEFINDPTRIVAPQDVTSFADPAHPDHVGDLFGHGTVTAGIAAAPGNNSVGVAGVAWGIKIMPVKVSHQEDTNAGIYDTSDVIKGIAYVCDHNIQGSAAVRVINLSLGANYASVEPLYVEALGYARHKGILAVAATGNSGEPQIPPPANTPGCLAVGATTFFLGFEFLAPFSNYGPRLDMVAPGDKMYATVPSAFSQVGWRDVDPATGKDAGPENTGYAYVFGTSESAPYASGVASLVFAKYDPGNASLDSSDPNAPAAMVDRVRAELLASCDDLGAPGWDPIYGAGRLNAYKAVSAAALPATAPAPDQQQP